jgi:hypothetical protein
LVEAGRQPNKGILSISLWKLLFLFNLIADYQLKSRLGLAQRKIIGHLLGSSVELPNAKQPSDLACFGFPRD